MKTSCTIFLLLLSANFCFANIWQGDYLIQSQADADAFTSVCACTSIEGDLTISGNDIDHIDSLYILTAVNGSIDILNNEQLDSLGGFKNLLEIKGNLTFTNNQLTTIEGFELLENIGNDLIIRENENLEEIFTFSVLNRIENNITISLNPKLKKFVMPFRLQNCKSIQIFNNENLVLISGSYSLLEIEQIEIFDNKSLRYIGGFNRLEIVISKLGIIENHSLDTISAFGKLKHIGSFKLEDNGELSEIYGFNQLVEVRNECIIRFPQSIINEDHFKNLRMIGLLETNFTNFQSLEYIQTLMVNDGIYARDTLNGFSSVKKVTNLQIINNDQLKYIYGFDSLKEVTCISIDNNKNLTEIGGFNSLKSINANVSEFWNCFEIINNPSLHIISGFKQLKNVTGGLAIKSNDNLSMLDAFDELEDVTGNFIFQVPSTFLSDNYFQNLKQIEGSIVSNVFNFKALERVSIIRIEGDELSIDTLSGYPALKYAWHIFIHRNNLTHIDAFHKLEEATIIISVNWQLKSIKGFNNLHTIHAELMINSNPSLEDITAFNKVIQVKENLRIQFNSNLNNISGFQNLVTAQDILIDNSKLQNISAFDKLTKVARLEINGSRHIQSIPEFNSLKSARYIDINNNINLLEVNGFNNLRDVFVIDILLNTNLVSISGFNQLKSLNILRIENGNLRMLDAFANLKVMNNLELVNNIHLRSIDNFSSLSFIAKGIDLRNNRQLNSCCILNCWIKQGVVEELHMNVYNNGMSCPNLQFIKNTCEETRCIENELNFSDLKTNNPVKERLQFGFFTFQDQMVDYTIYNINKQVIRKGSVMTEKGSNYKRVDLPDIERGYYFLQIDSGEFKEATKFLKL